MHAVQTIRPIYNDDGERDIKRLIQDRATPTPVEDKDDPPLSPPHNKQKTDTDPDSKRKQSTSHASKKPAKSASSSPSSETTSSSDDENKPQMAALVAEKPVTPGIDLVECDPKKRMFSIVLEIDDDFAVKTHGWIPSTHMPPELFAHGLPQVTLDPFLLLLGDTSSKANYPSGYLRKDVATILNYYAKTPDKKISLKKSVVTRLLQAWKIGAKKETNRDNTMEDNLKAMVGAIRNGAKSTESQAVQTLVAYCELIKQSIDFHEGTDHSAVQTKGTKPIPLHLTYLEIMYDTTSAIRGTKTEKKKPANTSEDAEKPTAPEPNTKKKKPANTSEDAGKPTAQGPKRKKARQ